VDRIEGMIHDVLSYLFFLSTPNGLLSYLAISGSTDRVDRLRNSKGALWRAKSNAIADVERKPDADYHDRIEHRRGLSR
jgi:hypothetical protein